MEHGDSIRQVLARFPDDAEALRPMLETVARLSQFAPQPSLAAQAKSRHAFLALASALTTAPARRSRLFQLLLPLATGAMVLLFSAGLVAASSSAVPGATLYGAKRFVENVRLWLVTDSDREDGLDALFRQERIHEIQQLLDSGAETDVEFEGVVQRIGPEEWSIAGLATRLDDDTRITGVPDEGATAAVAAHVGDGVLVARTITILSSGPSPQPSPAIPETPAAAIEPAATLAPPLEDRDGNRSTPGSASQPEPALTAMPGTPAPPAVQPPPTPAPGSSNDNGGDNNGNLNENGDDDDGPDPGGDDSNSNDYEDHSGDNGNQDGNDNDDDDHDDDDNKNDNDDDSGDDNDNRNPVENNNGGN
jgi:hypothetical protein